MATHAIPFVSSFEIVELPSDILLFILSLLHGQHIAKCIRVCRCFADLVHSDLYLQYKIVLAQSGMIDGHSSSLPLHERLYRLRHYISNFRSGTFHHESLFKDPDCSRQTLSDIGGSGSYAPVFHVEDSSTLYKRLHPLSGSFLSVVSHGSAQAGIQSRRLVIPVPCLAPENPWRVIDKWATDQAQDLLVVVDMSLRGTQGRSPDIRFYSLSGSKSAGTPVDHPEVTRPHWQIALPANTEPTADIEFLGIWITTDYIFWETKITDDSIHSYAIEIYNWKTGKITSRIDLATRPMHVVLLDSSYLLVTPWGPCPRSRDLIIYSISPSIPTGSRPLCTLQLPGDHSMNLAQPLSLSKMVMSASSSPPGGHFCADPSLSMVVLTYEGRGTYGALATYLLIPFTTILAQIRRTVVDPRRGGATADDSEQGPQPAQPPSDSDPSIPVPWDDWGARGCLRLRRKVGPHRILQLPRVIPFGSRIPIVVFHDDPSWSPTVYVVDINPLAARHAHSQARAARLAGHRGPTDPDRGATADGEASAVVEDVEEALPGVVDPECSAIPYAVYRFPLPPAPPERAVGYPIWSVEATMTGFALSLATATFDESLQSWTV